MIETFDMIELKYNTPVEVTREQYRRITNRFKMIVAHRRDDQGRYWIKLWVMEYKEAVERELNKKKPWVKPTVTTYSAEEVPQEIKDKLKS